jgi:cellobiose transport system permease protein
MNASFCSATPLKRINSNWHVAIPALRPALGFLGILMFIVSWNDYLWPLIALNDPRLYTLQLTLAQLNDITDYSMVMAGMLMATIPFFVIFFFGARQFTANISAGALKF